MSDEDLAGWIGTLDAARAVRIQQAYRSRSSTCAYPTGDTCSTARTRPSRTRNSSLTRSNSSSDVPAARSCPGCAFRNRARFPTDHPEELP